jgi:hypothetical protein
MPEPDRYGHARLTFRDNAGGKFVPCRFGQGAYAGILCENVVSGIARDLLAGALQRLEAAGYPVTLHIHDEVVCELPDGFGSLEEFHSLLTALPDWAAGLPVAAKVREGQRFSKPSKPAEAGSAVAQTKAAAAKPDARDELLGGSTDNERESVGNNDDQDPGELDGGDGGGDAGEAGLEDFGSVDFMACRPAVETVPAVMAPNGRDDLLNEESNNDAGHLDNKRRPSIDNFRDDNSPHSQLYRADLPALPLADTISESIGVRAHQSITRNRRAAGNNYNRYAGKIRCPFHDDHDPSLQLYGGDDPHYYCFGCRKYGPPSDLPEELLTAAPVAQAQTNDAATLAYAHRLWDEAQSIAGFLAEKVSHHGARHRCRGITARHR